MNNPDRSGLVTFEQYLSLRTQLSQDRRLSTPQAREQGTSLLRKFRMSLVLNFDQHEEHLLGHVQPPDELTSSDSSILSRAIRGVRGCLGQHAVGVAHANYEKATYSYDKKLQMMAFGDFGIGVQVVSDHLLEAENLATLRRNSEVDAVAQRVSGLAIDERWVKALLEKDGEDGFKAIDLIVQNLAHEKPISFMTPDFVSFGNQTARDVYKLLYKKLIPTSNLESSG